MDLKLSRNIRMYYYWLMGLVTWEEAVRLSSHRKAK